MLGIIVFTSTALILSIILAVADYYLTKEDERVGEIRKLLPGYNCGACGFGGCSDMAHNIVYNKVSPKLCRTMHKEQYEKLQAYMNSHGLTIKDN